jgi:hypothetical protein
LSRHDNQITRQENTACVIVAPRQSSSRRDRQNGLPDRRRVPIQIVALHGLAEPTGTAGIVALNGKLDDHDGGGDRAPQVKGAAMLCPRPTPLNSPEFT